MKSDAHHLLWAPERMLSPWNVLATAAQGPATFRVAGTELSYAELAERSGKLATGLARLGLNQGDRLATVMADSVELIELMLACLRLGAVFVPLNPFLKGRFLSYQVEDASPKLIVADAEGVSALHKVAARLPDLTRILVTDAAVDHRGPPETTPLQEAYVASPADTVLTTEHGHLPALILYTSGTTGASKGCILSHGYLIKVGALICTQWSVRPDDFLMTPFPLFHGAGLVGTIMTALVGGISYYNPGAFHASTFMAEAASLGATIAMGPGAAGMALLGQPPRDTDRKNRLRLASWIPLAKPAQEKFTERFGPEMWTESYGQTECMVIAMSKLGGHRVPESAGRASPLVEVEIHDDSGEKVSHGTAGEIVFRPKTSGVLFKGYWQKPEATAATWQDLWHHTGDFGFLDAQGFVHFLDRKKDAIRRRGENICSAELESAILEHPRIKEVAVHSVPSDMSEDEIKACVITEDNEPIPAPELFSFFRDSLPYYAIPRYVEFVTEFPRTGSMKVQKEALRKRGVASSWDFVAMSLSVPRADRRQTGA